jgi:peptide-methionine (R)-S-oxide reductase
MFIYAE